MVERKGIIVFTLWYIFIALSYWQGELPAFEEEVEESNGDGEEGTPKEKKKDGKGDEGRGGMETLAEKTADVIENVVVEAEPPPPSAPEEE